jgi:hypothetical protein
MGRPTKLTPEVTERYGQAVSAGVMPEVAARQLGISSASLYRWLAGSSSRHAHFRDTHERALVALEIRLTATVARAALDDPKMALELLQRRFPSRWGRSGTTTNADDPSQQIAETSVPLDPEFVNQVVPLLLEAGNAMRAIPAASEPFDVAAFADDGRSDNAHDQAEQADLEVSE